jgi:hypothetical protein
MRCLALVVVAGAIIAGEIGVGHLSAAKAPANYPVSVTFRDAGWCNTPPTCIQANTGADRILSDGKGSYVDGGGKARTINAVIINDANKDLSLDLFTDTGRTFQLLYAPATDVTQPVPPPYPSGYLNAGGRMVVNQLGTIAYSQTKNLAAHFTVDVGMFHFFVPPPSSNYGSQRVQVTRVSPWVWQVSTDSFTDSFGNVAGDLAVLMSGSTPLGLYHLPFGATITCQYTYNCPP